VITRCDRTRRDGDVAYRPYDCPSQPSTGRDDEHNTNQAREQFEHHDV